MAKLEILQADYKTLSRTVIPTMLKSRAFIFIPIRVFNLTPMQ